jgi:hypothetical protein
MLNYLEISFPNQIEYTKNISYIQYKLLYKLKKIKEIKNNRINIFFNILDDKKTNIEIIGVDDKVCNIHLDFPFFKIDEFNNLVIIEVFKAIEILFKLKGLDNSALKKIKLECETNHCDFLVPHLKKTKGKNNQYGELFINYTRDYAEFIFILKDKFNPINCENSFFKAKLLPMLFYRFFSKLDYRNEKFILSDDLNEIHFVFDTITNTCLVEFSPIENSIEEIKGYLKAFNYETPKEESLILFSAK